jgi:small subunit ribosomal protein S1
MSESDNLANKSNSDDAINREVEAAMSAMSAEEMTALTIGGSTPDANDAEAGGPSGLQMGRIVSIHGDDVFVDLGGKTQGVISKSLFKPDEVIAEGEPIEIYIDRHDRESDLIILSRKGAPRSVEWELLKPGDVVEGRIIGLNRGGLEVKLKGVTAFMPASQVDVMHVKDISIFLGESVRCEVVEIDRRGKNLTVSRRKVLEKERKANREELVKELEVGQVRKGVVGNLTEFGAFVDLGGVDGLIHISEMSYKQIKKPSEVVNPGDVVEVKILKIQGEGDKQRISLGLKQTQPDPWEGVADRFPVDSTHKVRVVRLADFGAFAQLEEGIDGLIPVSEMAWNRIGSPKEVVEVGQLVDVSVLKVEPKRKRISLSMKKAQPDPWAGVIESYTPETEVNGKVTRLADFGAFIEIAPGIEGMAHISELSEKRIKSCGEVLKVGQVVKARVLRIDEKTRRIGLSLKPADAGSAPLSLGVEKSGPPKKKNKKLRGGLSGGWDWAGTGFDNLGS